MIYTGSIYTPFETLPITVITRVVQRSDKVGQRLALCSFQEMAFLPLRNLDPNQIFRIKLSVF